MQRREGALSSAVSGSADPEMEGARPAANQRLNLALRTQVPAEGARGKRLRGLAGIPNRRPGNAGYCSYARGEHGVFLTPQTPKS